MIKNRFYKTTIGVPFELVTGKTAKNASDFPTFGAFASNSGSGAAATVAVGSGAITTFTVSNGGSGYKAPPKVTIVGDGTGATATATIVNGVVTAITKGAGGTGYTAATVTIEAASANVGDYAAFVQNSTGDADALTFGTALTATQKKKLVFLSYMTADGAVSPTPIVGETVKAQLVAYAAPTKQDARIVKQSGTVQVTQQLVLKVIETTPLTNALPSYDYNAVVVTDLATALASLATQINASKESEFFTAVAITNGIQVVSKDANRHFRLAMTIIESRTQPYNDTTWAYSVTTPAYAGSGTVDQVNQLLLESDIKRGVTTQYPHDGMSPLDFGAPVSFLDLSGATTYDIVVLTGTKFEDSPTPIEVHHNKATYFVVVPAGQGAAVAATFA